MNKPIVLRDPKNIDLSRHGVIEAHAGTGKTWTIVEMVKRILETPVEKTLNGPAFIHAREVLLVTFTEKAAGELKGRIRKGIEERIKQLLAEGRPVRDPLVVHLENCLNNLHESLIGTIHGICLRLLQTWPFETRVHFETEIVDDVEGLETTLRESMRTDWQDALKLIPRALDEMAKQGLLLDAKHFELILKTAKELLDGESVDLDRSFVEGNMLRDLMRKYDSALENSRDGFIRTVNKLRRVLDTFGPPGTFHPNAVVALEGVKQWAVQVVEHDIPIDPGYAAGISTFKKPDVNGVLRNTAICNAGFKKTPAGRALDEALEAVGEHAYVGALRGLRETLPMALVCDAAELLAQRWDRAKREKGQVSFQDMLRLMYRAVGDGCNPFVKSLRQRLRFGIIDEFQDTSLQQWEIFRTIFLEGAASGEGPRLFIVGDPKQSIYSFQGADVESYLLAKQKISEAGGGIYYLEKNFRSLDGTIRGYNAILGHEGFSGGISDDWFLYENSGEGDISYPAAGDGGKCAEAPKRENAKYPLTQAPVQVMALQGNKSGRLKQMAGLSALAIARLKGIRVSVPDGAGWKDLSLDYEHFAIIVEEHAFAEPFLEACRKEGIPAAKYKMEGVFQSPMARDLHALLRAILFREGDPAPRLAALLTCFFNLRPQDIDPEKDLEPCKTGNRYKKSACCISHALEGWSSLSGRYQWAQLFQSILERTGIRERLIRLADGERHLADLKQVVEYAIEKLYQGNYTLEQLVEHLGRLYDEKESAGQDRNLHVLATQKSSVRVLTMHAAKGLEFPVVFAVAGSTKDVRKGPNDLVWKDAAFHRHVLPYLSKSEIDENVKSISLMHSGRERRRLLYVALTRAQALLFIPMHFQSVLWDGRGAIDLGQSVFPKKGPDNDLTMRLARLFSENPCPEVRFFDSAEWVAGRPAKALPGAVPANTSGSALPDIPTVNLLPFICRQTSYTQLSRGSADVNATPDREVDRCEEKDEAEAGPEIAPVADKKRPVLPGGKKTGDALHVAIEELLLLDDMKTVLKSDCLMDDLVGKTLARNGVLKRLTAAGAAEKAVAAAREYVRGALTTPLKLPGGGTIAVADLEKADRTPEMEFLLRVDPHWLGGFMDLVFRVHDEVNPHHPWRYFVLDWKSNQVAAWDDPSIDACITENHYDLQAKIYCHALDKYLKGVLGGDYDPARNLGGAVYVFLRGFDGTAGKTAVTLSWTRAAEPAGDETYTQEQIETFVRKKNTGKA